MYALNQRQSTIPISYFKKSLEILRIPFTKKEIDDLQFYLANKNCLELDNYQKISDADIHLNILNFVEVIYKCLNELNYNINPQIIIM
jgi:hypothetical protein